MDAISKQGIERRASLRIRSSFTTRYRLKGRDDSPECVALTSDVSAAGVAFEAAEPLPVGADVELVFIVPATPRILTAEGRVTRVEEVEPGACYQHGVVFRRISLEDQRELEKHVHSAAVDALLREAIKRKASDVHLVANGPAMLRIDGVLTPVSDAPITAADLESMILSMMSARNQEEFQRDLDTDFSYSLPEGARFRVNAHVERGTTQAALRVITSEIRTLQELGLPSITQELAQKRKGLIIASGPAGSGKSSTLAAFIDAINRERQCMIISIEDPIEYVHASKKSVVKQREVGVDTVSFESALKHVLRQDPNVIMVGEMRDLESISMSISAAETGHLVLTTLHTQSAAETVHRIVDVYPSHQQPQIRSQLAECLQAVIAQTLLPRKDGKGRVLATEVLIGTSAVRNLIRQGQVEQIASFITAGAKHGMQSMDDSLAKLVAEGAIDEATARVYAKNPAKFGG